METLTPIIVALIGTTGLAGLLTWVVNNSRVSRLRKSIKQSLELAEPMATDSTGRQALLLAAERDSLWLASMSIVPFASGLAWGIAGVVTLALLTALVTSNFFETPLDTRDAVYWLGVVRAFVQVAVLVLGAAAGLFYARRKTQSEFVEYATLSGTVEADWQGFVPPRASVLRKTAWWDFQQARKDAKREKREAKKRRKLSASAGDGARQEELSSAT